MSSNNSLSLFDQLASEIFLEIFDYLSSNEIIYTFFDYNQRFQSILSQYQRYINHFETPTANFYFWENILPIIGVQIECLTITTMDFGFSLNLFPNLKSVRISTPFPVNYDRLYSIMKSDQFKKLNSFQIKNDLYSVPVVSQSIGEYLFYDLFSYGRFLKTLECSLNFGSATLRIFRNFPINERMHSLSLILSQISSVVSFLRYTPNLKDLNLIVTSLDERDRSDNFDLPQIKLKKFHYTLDINRRNSFITTNFNLLDLIGFTKQFSSSLVCLSLDLRSLPMNESRINGIVLEEQLLRSLIQLKTFHFYIQFDQISSSVENILSTFKNQFWFDHQWSMAMHKKYLYTLPFHFDQLNDFTDFDHVKSTSAVIRNSPLTWSYNKRINFSAFYVLNSNLIKQIQLKMPHLTSITLTSFSQSHPGRIEDQFDETDVTLDSVTTVCFRGPFSKSVQQHLIEMLPNFKHLILPSSVDFLPILYQKIERINIGDMEFVYRWEKPADVYFPNIKYAEIQLDHSKRLDVFKVIEHFWHSKALMLYFDKHRSYGAYSMEIILDQIFDKLTLTKTLENYRMIYGENCIQLIKKPDSIDFSIN